MPKILFDHLDGCKPTKPCASCVVHEFLRANLEPGKYEEFLALLEKSIGVKIDTIDTGNKAEIDLDMPFDKLLELSSRAKNMLQNDNINTVAELVRKSKQELRRIPNFGKISLTELEQELSKVGLKLNMHIPPTNAEQKRSS